MPLENPKVEFATVVLISRKGRMILDKSLLASNLEKLLKDMGIGSFDVEAFLASCERESAPSSRLTIQPVKTRN